MFCGKSSYKCTILGQGKQFYLILVCLNILCNKGDESSLKVIEKQVMEERREGEPPPSKKEKLKYCISGFFRGVQFSRISRFRKNYTQKTKILYGSHLIFDRFVKI